MLAVTALCLGFMLKVFDSHPGGVHLMLLCKPARVK